MRRRRKRPPSDLSFGLLEMAARAAGFSMLRMMDPDHAIRAARWLAKQAKATGKE